MKLLDIICKTVFCFFKGGICWGRMVKLEVQSNLMLVILHLEVHLIRVKYI